MTVLSDVDREAWLAARRTGIGASDAAAVLGLSPWQSQFTIWLDKTGQALDDVQTDAMEWGLRLEPVVVEKFEDETGLATHKADPFPVRHREHSWMLCSPDRLIGDDEGLEVKTGSPWDDGWDGVDQGLVPDHVVIQMQHSMAVTGRRRWHGAVLIGGRGYHQWTVDRDEQFIADLIVAEGRWWDTYVVGNQPPPVDGHDATTNAIKDLFPTSTDAATVDLPPSAHDLIVEWAAAKERKKQAEWDENEAANGLRLLLGDNEIGTVGGIKAVTWKSHTVRKVNLDRLRAEFPEAAEACTEIGTQRPLKQVRSYL